MNSLRCAALAGVLMALVAQWPALASDFDGSKPLICAATEALVCPAVGECKQGTAESLGIPQFFWADIGAKSFGEKDPDGEIRSGSIQSITQSPTYIVLQGSRESLGWSGTISKASGRLTLTQSNGGSAMIVRGICTPGK